MTHTRTITPLALMLIVLALAWALLPTQRAIQPAIPQPALTTDTAAAINTWLAAAKRAATRATITISPDQLPNFPKDPCEVFSRMFGYPCRWVITSLTLGREVIYEASLKVGEFVLGRVTTMEVALKDLEMLKLVQYAGHLTGWLASIEVPDWLRQQGIGTALWQVSNTLALHAANGEALRIFVDGAGWGEKLMGTIPNVYQVVGTSNVFLYLVK